MTEEPSSAVTNREEGHSFGNCDPLVGVQSVLTGLFAVLGTVVGSVVTYLLQRRSAERAERFARDQRLWQERLQAYGAFAEAVIEYRRSQYDRWHRHAENPSNAAYIDARTESYRLKAIARQTMFRVKLLTSDRKLIARVNEIMRITEDLHKAAGNEDLKVRGDRAQQLVDEFIDAASVHVQDVSSQVAGSFSAGYTRDGLASDLTR